MAFPFRAWQDDKIYSQIRSYWNVTARECRKLVPGWRTASNGAIIRAGITD